MRPESGPNLVAWFDDRREWQRRSLCFVAGALSALALPPVYAFPLLFLCLPVLFLFVRSSSGPYSAFSAGWWFGLGHFAAGLYWVGIAFLVNEDVSNLGAPFAVGFLAGVLAVFLAVATLSFYLVRHYLSRSGRRLNAFGQILLFALLWSLAEWLRGHLFTGFPWNLIGSVWAFWDAPAQAAALVGTYGLGLLTMIILLAPATFFIGSGRIARFAPSIGALTLLCAMVVYGLHRVPEGDGPQTGVELRVVQANIDQRDKWRNDKVSDNFIRFLDLSRLPRRSPPDLIIWPETAVAYFLEREPSRRFLMADVIPEGSYILTGAPRIRRHGEGDFSLWNSLHAIDHYGEVAATYDKVHLVPFGEYLPLRSILEKVGLTQFVPSAFDFTHGADFKTIRLPLLPPFSPLICYEIIFPGAVARDDIPPAWLLNVTNDAWYGMSTGPYQHLVTARMRAIEEGVPVVRAAGTGISAVIDAYGRIVDSVGLDRIGVIDAQLPDKVEHRTIYARIGDWSYLALLLIFAVILLSQCALTRDKQE